MQNNFSLKGLIEVWVNQNSPKKTYFQLIEDAWLNVSPIKDAGVAEIVFETQELIIETKNHLVLCNLQFQALELLQEINKILTQQNEKPINKIRFRLFRAKP